MSSYNAFNVSLPRIKESTRSFGLYNGWVNSSVCEVLAISVRLSPVLINIVDVGNEARFEKYMYS